MREEQIVHLDDGSSVKQLDVEYFMLCWIAALQRDWSRWDKVLNQWPERPRLLSTCLKILEVGCKRHFKRMAELLGNPGSNGSWSKTLLTVSFTALKQPSIDAKPLIVSSHAPSARQFDSVLINSPLAYGYWRVEAGADFAWQGSKALADGCLSALV